MPQRIVALDISDSEVKAAVLETTFRDYRVAALQRETISIANGTRDEQVRRFVEKLASPGDTILSSLPGDRVAWRTLFLPFRDRKRLVQTVPFELENNVAFGLDEAVVDYHIIHRDRAGTTVLAALVPKEDLERHLEMLQGAGADPKIVDLCPLATLNTLNLIPDLPPTFAFLDLGVRATTVALYREKQLVGLRTLTRSAPVPAEHTNGSGAGENGASPAAALVGEIRWTLLALNGAPLDDALPCYVAGDPIAVDTVQSDLERELPIDVRRFDGIRLRNLESEVGAQASAFTSSIGLALREVAPANGIGVNFRRGEFTFHRSQQELRRALRGVVALAAVVVALTMTDFYMEYRLLAQRASAVDAEIQNVFHQTLPDVARVANPGQELQSEIDALRARVAVMNDVVPVSTSTSVDILRAISSAVPNKIRIDTDEYTMDPDAVRMRANTDTFESVDTIKQELLKTGFFRDVEVKDAKADPKGGGVDFRLQLDLAKVYQARQQ
jgi:type II secretory pathway component PulL